MSWQDRDEFLKKVLSHVKFFFDHDSIEKELSVHLEERKEGYISDGYTEKEAEELTLTNFGDPSEIGRALNQEHNPLLGWLYYLTNVFVVFIVVISIIPLSLSILGGNHSRAIPKENILYRIDVDEKVKIDDRVIHFKEVIYEKNGNLNIIYSDIDTRLFGRGGWSLGSIGLIYDESGQLYFDGSGSFSGGFFTKGLWNVRNFPKDAEKLIIEYDSYNRYYKVEIPLKAGAAHE